MQFKTKQFSFTAPNGEKITIKARRAGIGYSIDIIADGNLSRYKIGRNKLMFPDEAIETAYAKWVKANAQ
jgi:hypothetical protein